MANPSLAGLYGVDPNITPNDMGNVPPQQPRTQGSMPDDGEDPYADNDPDDESDENSMMQEIEAELGVDIPPKIWTKIIAMVKKFDPPSEPAFLAGKEKNTVATSASGIPPMFQQFGGQQQ